VTESHIPRNMVSPHPHQLFLPLTVCSQYTHWIWVCLESQVD